MNERILWTGIVVVLWAAVFFLARKWARGRKAARDSRPPGAPRPIPKEWL
jgi:hypothetical protein